MADAVWGGGSFIVDDAEPRSIAIPEEFTESRLRLAAAAKAFAERDGTPADDDTGTPEGTAIRLIRRAGELGLLRASMPEARGGFGPDIIGAALVAETLASASSSAPPIIAQAERGGIPIALFGTPDRKSRWLPKLASGELIAAYCPPESDIGSEALGQPTSAALSEDGGHYVLNGSMRHVANAGIADLFILYAKVDGAQVCAFVVERGVPGLAIEPEESKRGSGDIPTCRLLFEKARIPADNLLGEVGQGDRIALDVMNLGRFKLSAGCVGVMKEAVALASAYANRSKQHGKSSATFPLAAAKLADMNARTFVAESMVYRTAGLIGDALAASGRDGPVSGAQAANAFAEYALECSIVKVFASEALEAVADEAYQIYGGLGRRDDKVERICRESRMNRILEGTNEVNRLFIPATLLKRALKSDLPLIEKAQALRQELLDPRPLPPSSAFPEACLAKPAAILSALKKTFLMVGGLAVQKHGLRLEREQTIVASLADAMIDIYALESALLRSGKLSLRDAEDPSSVNPAEMTALFAEEAAERAGARSRAILASLERGDELLLHLSVLRRLLRYVPGDATALRKRISSRVAAAEDYVSLS